MKRLIAEGKADTPRFSPRKSAMYTYAALTAKDPMPLAVVDDTTAYTRSMAIAEGKKMRWQ